MRRLVDESPAALASLNPELPPWFVAMVDRLLEKDPARRFGSAREVSELLGGCLAHIQQPASVPLPAPLQAYAAANRAKPKGFALKRALIALASLALLGTIGWLSILPGDDVNRKEVQSRTVHELQSSVQEPPTKKSGPETDEPPTAAAPARPQSDQAPVASTKVPEVDPGKMLLFGETDEYDAVINDATRMLTKQKKSPGLLGYGKVTLNSAGKVVRIPNYEEGIVSKETKVVMGKFDDKKKKWVAGEPMQGAAGWDLLKEPGKVLQVRITVAADKKTITNILIKDTNQSHAAASREFNALLKGVGPQTNGRGTISYHKVELDAKGSVVKKFPPTQGLITRDTRVAMGKYDADKKTWEAGEDIPDGVFGHVFKNLKKRPVLVRMRLAEVPAPTGQENGSVVQILVREDSGSAER
jgi:hypothetical protein